MIAFFFALAVSAQSTPTFRLTLVSEPATLSPYRQRTSSAAYLFSQIHSPLLRYSDGLLKPYLARCSMPHALLAQCHLFPGRRFSNNTLITADHVRKTFIAHINSKNPSPRADLLLNIKGAAALLSGQGSAEQIGIEIKDHEIQFHLERPDSEFLYTLANPLFSVQYHDQDHWPEDPVQIVTSGPYQIQSWQSRSKIILKPNPYFPNANQRPSLEFLFVSEDSVALGMYKKDQIDFLRRLPTLYIPAYKKQKDYHQISQFRFDYIGFGKQLHDFPKTRKALSEAINYKDWQKLFSAEERPGCPGIPKKLMQTQPCLNTKKIVSIPKNEKAKLPQLRFISSKQGGEDHLRASEWLQAEWKKKLGLQVELAQLDNKIFTSELETQAPSLFRKGLAPDRPTCESALAAFTRNHKENYIHFDDKDFDSLIAKMSESLKPLEKTKLCSLALEKLIKKNALIPTGPIYFAILAKPHWKGWKLNSLNQLDLTDLRYSP